MTDCPLHNESFDGDDAYDLYQFISLVNMCRDEQMFASYFAELNQHQEDVVEHPDEEKVVCREDGGGVGVDAIATGGTEAPSSSFIPSTSNARKTNKRRKFSPIIDKANQDAQRMAEEADMLDDLANTGVWDLAAYDEGGGKTRICYYSFKLTNELPYWKVGDIFGNREYLKEVLQQYAVMSNRHVYIKINDNRRFRAACHGGAGDYQWFVYLHKKPNGDYVVQTLNRDHAHTCSQVQENKWITSKWLGKQFTEKIKANPHIPLTAIRQCVDEQFGSILSRMKAYRAKDVALEGIYGNTTNQYKNLFYYKNELLRTHPDSRPLKIGWKRFCRPIIFLDACSLRGMYKGQILNAIGIDPNNGWWPIVWAVAEPESYEQWKWFLDLLDDDLELSVNGPRYVFMSDQQNIIAEKYPQSEHHFCVQHMYNNFKKRFSGNTLKKKMWAISDSTTEEVYQKNMDALRVYDQAAYQHLVGVTPKERWVKAYFSVIHS
ncbi:hypothetical protein AAHA92_02212 [Salvia divinorum]|uniref:MULE transposase domain-containing protein n=1 Tax=Salvia divinorum TaxID=28513 RepID=A0ABD1ID46_SALDI